MKEKIKFAGINYYCHRHLNDPEAVAAFHAPSDRFLSTIREEADITLFKHIQQPAGYQDDTADYYFFTRKNHFWQIPSATHAAVKQHDPGLVVVQGLIFPLQVMALRRKLGKKPVILLQHQAEPPYRRKKIFQQLADRAVDGYLFTSAASAAPWIQAGIIRKKEKVFELPPATTTFTQQNKQESRLKTGMKEGTCFLWVGRLNANKDPLTVLDAFEQYLRQQPGAYLYMLYTEADLLDAVQQRISGSNVLAGQVVLAGRRPHAELEWWYSAADYFILASHHEGGSFALMEAMACGCVPVVSNIPASMQMIQQGRAGFFFPPGRADALLNTLLSLPVTGLAAWSARAKHSFEEELSGKAIGKKLLAIFHHLQSQRRQ